jgi:hypothetical protein
MNTIPLTITGPERGEPTACESVLRSLPEWFGVESSLVQYANDAATLPTFCTRAREREPDPTQEARLGHCLHGFLCIREHSTVRGL